VRSSPLRTWRWFADPARASGPIVRRCLNVAIAICVAALFGAPAPYCQSGQSGGSGSEKAIRIQIPFSTGGGTDRLG